MIQCEWSSLSVTVRELKTKFPWDRAENGGEKYEHSDQAFHWSSFSARRYSQPHGYLSKLLEYDPTQFLPPWVGEYGRKPLYQEPPPMPLRNRLFARISTRFLALESDLQRNLCFRKNRCPWLLDVYHVVIEKRNVRRVLYQYFISWESRGGETEIRQPWLHR